MPSDAVTLAVSTGFSISVIAGIVSGICYVLAHGIKCSRNRKSPNPWKCSVCGCHLRSIDGILEASKVVTCIKCKGRVCRILCSDRSSLQEGWTCQNCKKHNESWFKGILKAIQPDSDQDVSFKFNMSRERISELDEDLEELRKKEKEQVRDFIERIVSAMLGGDVDETSITKIYNDRSYDIMFRKYHADLSSALTDLGSALHISIANLPAAGQSPCSAHASLKLLIQRIIQEAIDLPKLTKAINQPIDQSDESTRTYEDLLATAVLNKVIQSYQDELPSSSTNSVSSHISATSNKPRSGKEYYFGNETLENKWKSNGSIADYETTSHSSLEDWIKSDSSIKYVDQMSLTIHQSIEEVSPSDTEDEETDQPEYIHTSSITKDVEDPDWQNNWYLRKRRFNGTHSPVPVPMLVPNPVTEAKVLIGDKEAEDTSDLSDVASDYGDMDYAPSINSILVDSKTVIGGQNLLNGVDISTDPKVRDEEVQTEDTIVNGKDKHEINDNEELTFPSLDSNTEQEAEYTERYATLPKTILKSPTPRPRSSIISVIPNGKDSVFSQKQDDLETIKRSEDFSDDECEMHIKGSYSEREKEKWKHAIHLENNPYSKENIERRISSRSSGSSTSSLFGRDYYVREAAKPKGARKAKSDIVDSKGTEYKSQLSWPPPLQLESQETEDYEDLVVKAIPAKIENDLSLEISITDSNEDQIIFDLSSDSDLSIERVYNPRTGKITEKTGDKKQHIDENHNDLKLSLKRRTFLNSLTSLDDSDTQIKSPDSTLSLTETRENVKDNLVPSQIKYYEQISKCNIRNEKPVKKFSAEITLCTPQVRQNNGDALAEMMVTDILDDFETEKPETESNIETFIEETTIEEIIIKEKPVNYQGETDLPKIVSVEAKDTQPPESFPESSTLETDSEILHLQDKHLVKNVLGELSKSYPNLAKASNNKNEKKDGDKEEGITSLPSVQDLRRLFEDTPEHRKINAIIKEDKQVYSLTARSIPRQFRQELKHQDDIDKKETVNNKIKDAIPSIKEDLAATEEHSVFPQMKSTIQFFEKLKSK